MICQIFQVNETNSIELEAITPQAIHEDLSNTNPITNINTRNDNLETKTSEIPNDTPNNNDTLNEKSEVYV